MSEEKVFIKDEETGELVVKCFICGEKMSIHEAGRHFYRHGKEGGDSELIDRIYYYAGLCSQISRMLKKGKVVDLTPDFYDEIKKLEDEMLKITDRVVEDGVRFHCMAGAMVHLLRTMGEILVSSGKLDGSLDEVLDRVLFDYASFCEYANHIDETVEKYAGDDEHYQNILEIIFGLRRKATRLAIAIIKHHFSRLK